MSCGRRGLCTVCDTVHLRWLYANSFSVFLHFCLTKMYFLCLLSVIPPWYLKNRDTSLESQFLLQEKLQLIMKHFLTAYYEVLRIWKVNKARGDDDKQKGKCWHFCKWSDSLRVGCLHNKLMKPTQQHSPCLSHLLNWGLIWLHTHTHVHTHTQQQHIGSVAVDAIWKLYWEMALSVDGGVVGWQVWLKLTLRGKGKQEKAANIPDRPIPQPSALWEMSSCWSYRWKDEADRP